MSVEPTVIYQVNVDLNVVASLLDDALEEYKRKMAERGASLVRQEVIQGQPVVGTWPRIAGGTQDLKKSKQTYGIVSGKLYKGVYCRKARDTWEYGVEHPGAKMFEFGHKYWRSGKQTRYIFAKLGNYNSAFYWTANQQVTVPERPLIMPASQQLIREEPSIWESTVGNIWRLAT